MKLTLVNKIHEADATYSFLWQPDKKVNYLPGQYMYFTLSKLLFPDPRGATRHFTLSSSPTEKYLMFSTRMRKESGYKQTLSRLSIGDQIECDGPNGEFILDEKKDTTQIFLAGGIGITPFRSMIVYDFEKSVGNKIILFYSNSNQSEITFKSELEKISKKHKKYTIFFTVSKTQKNWNGLNCRINSDMLEKHISKSDLNNSVFWVSGPPPFVSGMEKEIERLGIETNIYTDRFTGY